MHMRWLAGIILIGFCTCAYASEEAVFESERGFHWLEFHQPRRALQAFHKALDLGLPPQRDLFVRAAYCETALTITPTQPLIAFCRDAYEGYRNENEPNRVAAVNGILATMAVELAAKAFYPDAEWAISELRSRKDEPWDPSMPFQEQRVRIGSAFLHVMHNRGQEALAELDMLRSDKRLLIPPGFNRAVAERLYLLSRILRFYAFNILKDEQQTRLAIKETDDIRMLLKTPAAMEYSAVVMLCEGSFLAHSNTPDENALRTDGFLFLMETLASKFPEWPMLIDGANWRRVKECGGHLFYVPLRGAAYVSAEKSKAGQEAFRELMDEYRKGSYGDVAARFDHLIAALNTSGNGDAILLARRFNLLKSILLNSAGVRSDG
jgi:hypothetical protein